MMGTRTGDLDTSVMNYLCTCTGKSVEEMIHEADERMYEDKARIKAEIGTGGRLVHLRN